MQEDATPTGKNTSCRSTGRSIIQTGHISFATTKLSGMLQVTSPGLMGCATLLLVQDLKTMVISV
jgi:hypothetical protein